MDVLDVDGVLRMWWRGDFVCGFFERPRPQVAGLNGGWVGPF